MILDSLLTPDMETASCWISIIDEEGELKLHQLLATVHRSLESAAWPPGDRDGLVSRVAELFRLGVASWRLAPLNEAPNTAWLRTYLTSEAGVQYQAWSLQDLVWAIHGFFSWSASVRKDLTPADALSELCHQVGIEPRSCVGLRSLLPRTFRNCKKDSGKGADHCEVASHDELDTLMTASTDALLKIGIDCSPTYPVQGLLPGTLSTSPDRYA